MTLCLYLLKAYFFFLFEHKYLVYSGVKACVYIFTLGDIKSMLIQSMFPPTSTTSPLRSCLETLQRVAVWTGNTWSPSSWPSGDTAPTSQIPTTRSEIWICSRTLNTISSSKYLSSQLAKKNLQGKVNSMIRYCSEWVCFQTELLCDVFTGKMFLHESRDSVVSWLLLQRLKKTRRFRSGSARLHPYKHQVSSLSYRPISALPLKSE